MERGILKRIDLPRLSGINRLLGIHCTDDSVRVVELEKRGSFLNRFKAAFQPVCSFELALHENASTAERARDLVQALHRHGVRTRHAVVGIQSKGVKNVVASVQSSVKNLDEWIGEHHEKLLKLPLPLSEVSYAYEVLTSSDAGPTVEITFVRKTDIEDQVRFVELAGLQPLAVGAGTRDALTALVGVGDLPSEDDLTLIAVEAQSLELTTLQKGRRKSVERHMVTSAADSRALKDTWNATTNRTLVTGSIASEYSAHRAEVLRPWGLGPEFAVAAGLAVKGFIPELSPVNLLADDKRELAEASMYRSLTRRGVLALGLILFLLLLLPTLASLYLESRLESASAGVISNDSTVIKVRALEHEVDLLAAKVQAFSVRVRRTEYSRILHDVAAASHEGLWFDHLLIRAGKQGGTELVVSGQATSNDDVTRFLKSLEASPEFKDVTLLRLGSHNLSERLQTVTASLSAPATFEVKAAVKAEGR